MGRTEADVEAFFNDLDTDEVAELVQLVDGLDPLEMEGGEPKYTAEQINLIQRFQQFVIDHPAEHAAADDDVDSDFEPEDDDIEVDESGLEKETLHEGDSTEDVPGTGEVDEPAGCGGLSTADVNTHTI